jgi:hypothetical protein
MPLKEEIKRQEIDTSDDPEMTDEQCKNATRGLLQPGSITQRTLWN